ncbi:hypothetical protein ACW5WQ_04895 [Aeromonas rivuli]|nr:hypothetical protein [Aeromonas rivuli]
MKPQRLRLPLSLLVTAPSNRQKKGEAWPLPCFIVPTAMGEVQ